MTTARRNPRHHEGPTEPNREKDVRLSITADMAGALGPIAGQHSGAFTIWHAADHDPENIWRVRVDEAEASYLYLVDDETGTIDPEPGTYYDGHRIA